MKPVQVVVGLFTLVFAILLVCGRPNLAAAIVMLCILVVMLIQLCGSSTTSSNAGVSAPVPPSVNVAPTPKGSNAGLIPRVGPAVRKAVEILSRMRKNPRFKRPPLAIQSIPKLDLTAYQEDRESGLASSAWEFWDRLFIRDYQWKRRFWLLVLTLAGLVGLWLVTDAFHDLVEQFRQIEWRVIR